MTDLWTTLVPLIIGSAVVPVQILVTIMLVRSSLRTATAWVAGMAAVRLVQGVLFGFVFYEALAHSGSSGGPGFAGSTLLLVLAVLFYVTAIRQALADDDSDAPPPKWMAKVGSMSWPAALGAGATYVAIAPKFWVFTLGAVGAIVDAQLGAPASIATFIGFVALALSVNLAILACAAVSPERSAAALERLSGWLQSKTRLIAIVLGVVFGTWFLVKALAGFGII
jgi:threonine/homoserine/homoserine lactone efflux protein